MEGANDYQLKASLTDSRNLGDTDYEPMTQRGEREAVFSEDSTCSVDNLLSFFLI
jgi:hypothetical protein